MVEFVLFFAIFCFVLLLLLFYYMLFLFFFLPLFALHTLGSVVSSLRHQLGMYINAGFVFCFLFFEQFVAAVLFSFRSFFLPSAWSCRVGQPPGHMMGLIAPAKSKLDPTGLGLSPERMHDNVGLVLSFLFFSFLLCFFPLLPYVALVVLLCIIVLFLSLIHI